MAAPQALTPEQIQQIIAAGRGNTVNLNGTIYQGNYADTGSGETFQEGALQDIYGYTPEQNKVGGTYNQYDPTGAFSRTGTQQEVNATEDFIKFLAGAGLTFALPGALNGSLFGGAGAASGAGTTFAGEALADAGLLAGGGAGATAGLTAAQIANLAKAGINVAGLLGAGNAITNMGGGGNNTSTPITYSGGGAGGYSPEYFSQLQSNYNSLMPNVPRDVASPLQNWYSTEFNPGASVTGSLFGDMVGGVKPVTPPVVKPPVVPVKTVATSPLYASLTKTSTPVDVAKAYTDFIASAGGNTAANRQAATDYLTNLGLTQGQIESSYSAYLDTLPAAGNTYQQLNAKATPSNVVQAYTAFVANAGGDTATNRQLAADYLKDIGVSDALINQAYNTYLASTTNTAGGGGGGGNVDVGAGGGMMSGGGGASTTGTVAAAAPSYTTLGASSSPQSIAAAYADFVANSGGDTAANQQAAVEYLTNLGIGQDTIGSAYGLFKGA